MDELAELQERLGYRFLNRQLLITALTHSSFHGQGSAQGSNYERLEFLGDTLLGFVVADWLMKDDQVAAEGVLSRRRQTVVRASTLAQVAGQLALGDALRLGPGELRTGGRSKPSLLADAFEAVVGAVYQDGGLRRARSVALRHLKPHLLATRGTHFVAEDSKTRLQELIQGRHKRTPVYKLLNESGPAHEPLFEAAVFLGRRQLARGTGQSRKEAEQRAARRALQELGSAQPSGGSEAG